MKVTTKKAKAIDANEIIPGVWMGGMPPYGLSVADAGFSHLVLCASEYQLQRMTFPRVEVVYCPLEDDGETLSDTDIFRANACAQRIADIVHTRGKQTTKILITCVAGRNRSGLVTALTIRQLIGVSGARAAQVVRTRREAETGPALSNPAFMRYLLARPGLNSLRRRTGSSE